MFRELFEEQITDTYEIGKYIKDKYKYLQNGGGRGDTFITLYTKLSKNEIKQIDVIWMEVDNKAIDKDTWHKMSADKDYSFKREQIQIRKMKNGWKTTKETKSKIIQPNQKLSDDDLISILNQLPYKG